MESFQFSTQPDAYDNYDDDDRPPGKRPRLWSQSEASIDARETQDLGSESEAGSVTDYLDCAPEEDLGSQGRPDSSQWVCLGKLISMHFQPSKAVTSKIPRTRFRVDLRSWSSDTMVQDIGSDRLLGFLAGKGSACLAPFLDMPDVDFEAFALDEHYERLENGIAPRSIDILIYAPDASVNQVGAAMTASGLNLQHPSICDNLSRRYRNPQYLLAKGAEFPDLQIILNSLTDSDSNRIPSQETSFNAMHQNFFDVAGGPASYRRAASSNLLSSKLEPHQEKAVAMMTEKELGLQAATDFPSMWERIGPVSAPNGTYRNTITGAHQANPRVPLGGLLADDMGLGKTLSIIALIANSLGQTRTLHQNLDLNGEFDMTTFGLSTTLVVTPKAIIGGWHKQLEEHTKPKVIRVCHYYGRDRLKKLGSQPQLYDVILTTYGVITKEYSSLMQATGTQSPIFATQWFRTVFDEGQLCINTFSYASADIVAHFLRNTSTKVFKAAYAIRSERTWCLTGTPIQNSIMDLGALIQLVRLVPFDNLGTFTHEIVQPLASHEKNAIAKLRRLIACFSLRRTKEILNLPPKHGSIELIPLSAEERQLYDVISARLLDQVDKDLSNGINRRSLAHVMEQILRLRQICNHGRELLPTELLRSIDTDSQESMFSQTSELKLGRCEMCDCEVEDILQDLDCFHTVCKKCSHKLQQESPEAEGVCPVCAGMSLATSSQKVSIPRLDGSRIRQIRPSSKVSRLLEILKLINDSSLPDRPNKSVVFSEWTTMLDLVQVSLRTQNLSFARIDGQMNIKEWKNQMKEFAINPRCTVLLASIKNAGTGIDLRVANHVHLLEAQWNPMTEEQALDRVHRYGQQRPVNTYRYLAAATIEQYVQQKQAQKLELISASLNARPDDEKLTVRHKLQDLKNFFQTQADIPKS